MVRVSPLEILERLFKSRGVDTLKNVSVRLAITAVGAYHSFIKIVSNRILHPSVLEGGSVRRKREMNVAESGFGAQIEGAPIRKM